jgi:putative folate metabolism gamma-glutamate ligase
MRIKPVKTHRITPGDSLEAVLEACLPPLENGDILVVTSKILSVMQGRLIPKQQALKEQLVCEEADFLLKSHDIGQRHRLTIKDGLLIPCAGIDESNGDDSYILYPQNMPKDAECIWHYGRQKYGLNDFGVLITDSHTTPMRRGVTGIALAWCGFTPLYSYIGKPDLFNHPLRVTEVNILDALAAAAVFVMGEGDEQTPCAVICNAPKVTFLNHPPTVEEIQALRIPIEEDLYKELLLPLEKWVDMRQNRKKSVATA